MVVTTATGSEERVRILSQADITASYAQAGGTVCGILGFAKADLATDSSGHHTAPAYPVSVSQQPHYAVLSLDYLNPSDPATGRARTNVFSAGSIIGGNLWENTTATAALNGVDVGILISTISGYAPTFFWSSAASIKVGEIFKVNEDDPYFNKTVSANVQDTTHNPRCLLGVRIFTAYQEALTGVAYAT